MRRPQRLLIRRALFQIHLWSGIAVGLYIFIVGLTGSVLVFREQIEANLYPELFQVAETGGPRIEMAEVIATVQQASPGARLLGVYSPAGHRETFIAWLEDSRGTIPVFVHPITGEILGTRPEGSWLAWLQDLHIYLLGGDAGLLLNGVGALVLSALCLTGLVIWWPGVENWRRSLKVDFRNTWKRINWDLHSAMGFWTSALILMWSATGLYFAFPLALRSVVDGVSPISAVQVPVSAAAPGGEPPTAQAAGAMIAFARRTAPGATLARVSLPQTDGAAFEVVMAPGGLKASNEVDYVSFYFDPSDGSLLQRRTHVVASAGDAVMAWVGALHVGSFGGITVKIVWAILGTVPCLMFVTGSLMWWNRVVSKKLRRGKSDVEG